MTSLTVADAVAEVMRGVLGPRLATVVAYGSSVTGDVLTGYSDLDLLIGLTGPVTLSDTLALEQAISLIEPAPYSYYQPTFVLGRPARPILVPGAFRVLTGASPESDWFCQGDDLRAKGETWLTDLPDLLAGDAADWAMTTSAHVGRRARLHLTQVKPSLRALMVRSGCDPIETWTATWQQIGQQVATTDDHLGTQVSALLDEARAGRDHGVAVTALHLLSRVCTHHLGNKSSDFLVVS